VLKEATKLAHGGTGDVKTEWFEEIFDRGLEKYEKLKGEMIEEVRKQDALLEEIRVSPASVISSDHERQFSTTNARWCTHPHT